MLSIGNVVSVGRVPLIESVMFNNVKETEDYAMKAKISKTNS